MTSDAAVIAHGPIMATSPGSRPTTISPTRARAIAISRVACSSRGYQLLNCSVVGISGAYIVMLISFVFDTHLNVRNRRVSGGFFDIFAFLVCRSGKHTEQTATGSCG